MYYFSTYQGNTISCGISEDTAQGNGYEGPIKWFTNGSTTVSTDCYVTKKGPRASNKVNGVDSTGIFYLENISYDDLFNFFKTLSITELDDASGEEDTPLPEDPGDPSEPEETEPTCASRAGELGWILCPLIKGAGELLQGFFEDWIEPFLQIDAELLSGTNNGVFEAWQGFQTIANLIFVVIFLFVIFSQLTGVGIDNYGIKKVLPKLIIGAVLINLSYIICQLAVDLSNILGSAMKSFFGSMPPSVAGVEIRVNGGAGTGWFEAGAVALTVIVGALVVQKVLTMGIMVIIPILILLLTVLFSLFFLFFMLGVRQALAIVLVTVSPLAFVCYILPNTKSLFKKWVDLFKAMLLAYPIASAMVWGGDLVSRILINANAAAGTSGVVESLGLLVTAAVVSIAPVFAIPGLLKKSLSAIDGVGGMLSKVQSGGRRGLDATEKGMRDSRVGTRMQTWQDSRNKKRDENRNLRRAGLRRNANGEIELSDRGRAQNRRAEKLGNGTTGRAYRQRLADARNAAFSNYNADMSANRVATGTGALATLAGLSAKQDRQAIEDEIINMAKGENANPLLAGTGNYDPNLMEDQLLGLMRKGDRTSEEKLRMKALVSKMSETGDGNKRIASILSGKKGAVDAGARKELASYITSNDVASKIGGKDMYVAQYMRDIEAGYYSADTSFDDWAVSASSMGNGVSNVEFVSKKILDDDDLLAKQSTDSLKRTIEVDQAHNGAAGTGTYTASDGSQHAITVGIADAEALSSGRAQKLVESDNIHTKEEQDTILTNRQNGNPVSRPAPQVQPGQQPVTPTVRTRLNPTQQQQQQNNP